MCEKTGRYWLAQMPLSWQHLKWKSTRLAQTFRKFSFWNLITTLTGEPARTPESHPYPSYVCPVGPCNWKELSGFVKPAIQMSNRKQKAGAHLQVTANQLHGTGLISIPIPTPQKWELHGLKHTLPEKLKANLLYLFFSKVPSAPLWGASQVPWLGHSVDTNLVILCLLLYHGETAHPFLSSAE